ncbi:hypothetical protein ABTY98_23800 [Streptomyces sp. NPDC096040]|uniref:hypothetical protein n=1 Tax=Streptomyces sp. NPDC096040 TaxID=3155541 RepID=UPI003329B4C2
MVDDLAGTLGPLAVGVVSVRQFGPGVAGGAVAGLITGLLRVSVPGVVLGEVEGLVAVGHLCVCGPANSSWCPGSSARREPSGGSLPVLFSGQPFSSFPPFLSLIANPPIHSTAYSFRR